MFVGAAGPVRAANSAGGGSLGAAHKGWSHDRIHLTNELWRNPLEALRRVGASEGHSYGVSTRDGRCQHCVEWFARASTRYALSGVRGIPRSKGTAARADGLIYQRVEGPKTGLSHFRYRNDTETADGPVDLTSEQNHIGPPGQYLTSLRLGVLGQ